MIIIGIDIGGSTTKIVGLNDGEPMLPMQVKATDPITSVYGAFGKYINTNKMSIKDISKIMVTGVGASFIKDDIYSIKTTYVNEFTAIGRGGLYLSGLKNAVIISMGTGTAFVKADSEKIVHIGGTGVGGGTLLGLSSKLLNIRNFESLVSLAEEGNLHNIDLAVGDISSATTASMPFETTASNFGKISDYATKSDIAIGLINMVFQTIGMMAVFACRIDKTTDVVLSGNLTTIPHTNQYFETIEKMWDVKFTVPVHAEYTTAMGAALTNI